MDLYIIEPPKGAPFFRGTRADAKGAARDCGGTWMAVIAPDRKEDRIAWLNDFAAGLYRETRTAAVRSTADLMPPAPIPPILDPKGIGKEPISPRDMCRLINEDRASEAITAWVVGADGWRLGNVIDACLARMSKLRGQLRDGMGG